MKITISWLNDFIQHAFSVRELADKLTMTGLEVESIDVPKRCFRGVRVGKIVAIEKIPKSEKLSLCKVDVGGEILSIVCGAPNVREGLLVPVAVIGAILPGNIRIEKANIRGTDSFGMICSARELAIADDHSGILELDGGRYRPGDLYEDASCDADTVLEINVTPNRPDCLNVRGIAREVGVLYQTAVRLSAVHAPVRSAVAPVKSSRVDVRIESPESCPRYSARLIREVHIGPSPDWMQKRLASVGVNAINNVVDVTNYVMMESGQPLHAFDYDLLEGGAITVRKAGETDVFVTLDGQERSLVADDLLICDKNRPVALAGVMGGLNSEVSEKSRHILLESAYFDPMTIRKTARRLGMASEACQRFERGVDPNGTVEALNRAVALIVEIAGGSTGSDVIDVYPRPILRRKLSLRPERLTRVLGLPIPEPDILRILTGLGLEVSGKKPFQVTVPTFRHDLRSEIDLIEEIIRHFGYDRIESKTVTLQPVSVEANGEQELTDRIRDILSGLGFLEAWNNSLVPKNHTGLFFDADDPVAVQNPLSPETAFLRTALLPGLLENIRWNHNRSAFDLRLFEIGNVVRAATGPLPEERPRLAGVLTESARTKGYWKSKSPSTDFFALKGSITALLRRLHSDDAVFLSGSERGWTQASASILKCGSETVGSLGEIERPILASFGIEERVFAFELSLKAILKSVCGSPLYRPIPRFPSIRRDLAVVVAEDVRAGDVQATIQKNGETLLQFSELFDVYQGKQIPAGRKSLAFSLQFFSPERTLKEEEIDPVLEGIVRSLEKTHGASLRAQ
jgi:phenylalanyl-tRNA synthetase beta chain